MFWVSNTSDGKGVKRKEIKVDYEPDLNYVTGMENIRDAIPFPRTPGSAEF